MFGAKKQSNEDSYILEEDGRTLICNKDEFDEYAQSKKCSPYSSPLRQEAYSNSYDKPNISYASLITQAITESNSGRLSLKEIYEWIMNKYPFFSQQKSGWQNSIRHNLSLNKSFYKVPRSPDNKGKGSYWCVNADYIRSTTTKPRKNHTHRSRINIDSHYSPARQFHSEERVNTLSEILGNGKSFFDAIGVSEIQPSDKNMTTVFDGDLKTFSEGYDQMFTQNVNPYFDEPQQTNHIFKFK